MYPETINYEKEKLILLKKESGLTKEFVKKLNYKEQEELTEDLVAVTNLINEVLTLNTMFKLLNTKQAFKDLEKEHGREILIQYDKKSKCADMFETTFSTKLLWAAL